MRNILEANNISLKVDGREKVIIDKTTLAIKTQDFVVILGHNGSGKSSLVKILSGERSPSSGSVLLDGIELCKLSSAQKACDIVTLAQKADDRLFTDLTLEENVMLWESRFAKENRLDFKKVMKLTNSQKRFALRQSEMAHNLSGGEKQSILLSLALAHPPKVLFLDEHTASLDPKASEEVMRATDKAITKHKITAIMVTHRLDDALKYGSRLIIMNEGKVVVDQPKSASLSKSELRDMMG